MNPHNLEDRSISVPILQMRKLRHREVSGLLKITWPVSSGVRIRMHGTLLFFLPGLCSCCCLLGGLPKPSIHPSDSTQLQGSESLLPPSWRQENTTLLNINHKPNSLFSASCKSQFFSSLFFLFLRMRNPRFRKFKSKSSRLSQAPESLIFCSVLCL